MEGRGRPRAAHALIGIVDRGLTTLDRNPCRRLSRQPAGAPGGLEVVAADQAVEVEDLADEVEAGLEPALEGPRVDLVEGDAAAGDLGLREPERAGDRAGAGP